MLYSFLFALPPLLQEVQAQHCALQARVVDVDGTAVAGAWMRVAVAEKHVDFYNEDSWSRPRDWNGIQQRGEVVAAAFSGADGLVRLEAVPADQPLRIGVEAPGFARASWLIYAPGPGDSADLGNVSLAPGQTVRIHIVDEAGRPAPGLGFTFEPIDLAPLYEDASPLEPEHSGVSDENGEILLQSAWRCGRVGIHWGSYQKMVPAGAVEEDHSEYVVTVAGGTGVPVGVRVVTPDGRPISGAKAGLASEDPMVQDGRRVPFRLAVISDVDWQGAYQSGPPTDEQGRALLPNAFADKPMAPYAFIPPGTYAWNDWQKFATEAVMTTPPMVQVHGRLHGAGIDEWSGATVRFERAKRGLSSDSFFFFSEALPCAADGSFQCWLPKARYGLRVRLPGGEALIEQPLDAGTDTDLGVVELPAATLVSIVALDQETGGPIAGLWGRCVHNLREPGSWNKAFGREREGNTPIDAQISDNVATWAAEQAGTHQFVLGAPGHLPCRVDINLDGNEQLMRRTIQLERSGTLVVTVRDADGRPLIDADLRVQPVPAPKHASFYAEKTLNDFYEPYRDRWPDPNGCSRFTGLAPGTYTVHVLDPSFIRGDWRRGVGPALAEVAVVAGGTVELEADLRTMAAATVLVRDPAGALGKADVGLLALTTSRRSETLVPLGQTDRQGRFHLPPLTPGRYRVGARASTTEPWISEDRDLAAGSQELTLDIGGSALSLQISGPSGLECDLQLASDVVVPNGDPEHDDLEDWMYHFQAWNGKVVIGKPLRIPRLPQGQYRLWARVGTDWVAWSAPFDIGPGETAIGEIALQPAGTIEVALGAEELAGRNNLPHQGSRPWFIAVWNAAGEMISARGYYPTEEPLRFVLPGGRYQVKAGAGFRLDPDGDAVELSAGEVVRLTSTLASH